MLIKLATISSVCNKLIATFDLKESVLASIIPEPVFDIIGVKFPPLFTVPISFGRAVLNARC